MERRAVVVQGIVQGVGLRPFVFSLASRLCLAGFVKNQSGSVHIEVEGESKTLDAFCAAINTLSPPLARIDEIAWKVIASRGSGGFEIQSSGAGKSQEVFVSPDIATCDDCLRELRDPRDRRYRYPFINCTNCGPRLTIVSAAPYDRVNTTMAPFAMCPQCLAEYEDPSNRRFHAQATCCPRCGPKLRVRQGRSRARPRRSDHSVRRDDARRPDRR